MKTELRLAMLGMIPGNGHPYSWSSIINGFDPVEIARCPYPVIAEYLAARPEAPIPGARVTHIWTDDPVEAPLVAAAARIPHVVRNPCDVIGEVDGVIIATDDGDDHVRRARPFVEAGLPVFVDKPLATNRQDLAEFSNWVAAGARILSTSGMRYSPEFEGVSADWRWVSAATPKTWERYGIHLLEPLSRLLGPGFESVRLVPNRGAVIAHISHRSGTTLTLAALGDAAGGTFQFHFYGKSEYRAVKVQDYYTAFRRQLESVVDWMTGATPPVEFAQTQELMQVLIAGRESAASGGVPVFLESAAER